MKRMFGLLFNPYHIFDMYANMRLMYLLAAIYHEMVVKLHTFNLVKYSLQDETISVQLIFFKKHFYARKL